MTTTTENFLDSVKRAITMPSNQVLLDDDDILAFADEAIKSKIIPMMDRLNQEFFVATPVDIPIESGVSRYRIPSRSYGRKIREIKLFGPDNDDSVWDFPQIALEREQFYQPSGSPCGFRFQGDWIHVIGDDMDSYTLRVWPYIGPGKLVLSTYAGVIQSIGTDQITLTATPPTAFMAGATIDLIDHLGANQCLQIDLEISSVAGNTLSFAADSLSDELSVGDYVAIAGQSPVLQLPDVVMPYLRTLVGMDCLGSISDFEGKNALMNDAKAEKADMLSLLMPRATGEPQILINQNGFLRRPFRGIGVRRGF